MCGGGGGGGGDRQGAPVLICPVDRPTARSAMKESSVSPLRWLVMTPHPASLASFTACARRRAALVTAAIWRFATRRQACAGQSVARKTASTRGFDTALSASLNAAALLRSGMECEHVQLQTDVCARPE